MKMIDPHLHIETCTYDDLEMMKIADICGVVGQIYYPDDKSLKIKSSTLFDLYDRLIHFETNRTKRMGIEAYVATGICMASVPTDWEKVIERLPNYLKEDKVVCLGEIGLDPYSVTADLSTQEEILKAQLEVARDYNVPVVFHTPIDEKIKWIERYGRLIDDFKIDKNKVLIDHAQESVVEAIWDIGCHAGITVASWREVYPWEAARIVAKGNKNLGNLMIDSDAGLRGADSLSVPKAVFEMQKMGISDSDIHKVVFDNPVRFYNLPIK